jgi:hypothetical protein
MPTALFAVTQDNELCYRTLEGSDDWSEIEPIQDIKFMTSIGGVLFFATSKAPIGHNETLAARLATLTPLAPGAIGHADSVVGMASLGVKLHVLTDNYQLWERKPVFTDSSWQMVGKPSEALKRKKVYALTAWNGKLVVAADDNRLYERTTDPNDDWKRGIYSNNARTLAAVAGDLYAVNADNQLMILQNGTWKILGGSEPLKTMTAAEMVAASGVADDIDERRTGTDG